MSCVAYVVERVCGGRSRFTGMFKGPDSRYRSAGTFDTSERALEVAAQAEARAAEVAGGAPRRLDPVTLATMTLDSYVPVFLRHHQVEANTKDTYEINLRLHVVPFIGKVRLAETDRTIARNYVTALQEEGRSPNTIRQCKVALAALFGMAVADGYLDINPFHDLKTPKVPGSRSIKIATHEQYLRVRTQLPNRPCKVFSTLMVSSGVRLCEAIALRPCDFDYDRCLVEVTRSVVKVSRKNHPQGKTFLVRDYTKNGTTRALRLDREVIQLIAEHQKEHEIGDGDLLFPAELLCPPRKTMAGLTPEEIAALGNCASLPNGRVYAHGTMGAYTQVKCRCPGCRQWARDYEASRRHDKGARRRRWEKSRDPDELYLDKNIWNRIWGQAVTDSGIPFKPTAYQVRHTHASWLIDAGESPKSVMHRLGQADLRTTARYVHVMDEYGESAAKRFEGLLPPVT